PWRALENFPMTCGFQKLLLCSKTPEYSTISIYPIIQTNCQQRFLEACSHFSSPL
ncbi:hypothetical protein KIL84_010709, partial [Mauremys mutica]